MNPNCEASDAQEKPWCSPPSIPTALLSLALWFPTTLHTAAVLVYFVSACTCREWACHSKHVELRGQFVSERQLSPFIVCVQERTRVASLGCRFLFQLTDLANPTVTTIVVILPITVWFMFTFLVWLKLLYIKTKHVFPSSFWQPLSLIFTSLQFSQDNRLSSQSTWVRMA